MSRALLILLLFSSSCFCQEFSKAKPGYTWEFPRDHGAHRQFETEWWYFTGALFLNAKQAFVDQPDFGFQLTFFRQAKRSRDSAQINQNFLAHAALSDIARGDFINDERRASELSALAGAETDRLAVYNHSWRAVSAGEKILLEYSLKGMEVRLILTPSVDPWLQGQNGYSPKGECENCASMYYSWPRLRVDGEIIREGKRMTVSGLAWMDHEFMSSDVIGEKVSWDWFSLMQNDGTAIMLFTVRRKDGSKDSSAEFTSGKLLKDGRSTELSPSEIKISPLTHWTSPTTKIRYPSSWRVQIHRFAIDLTLRSLLPNQEQLLPPAPTYWEGLIFSPTALGYAELKP